MLFVDRMCRIVFSHPQQYIFMRHLGYTRTKEIKSRQYHGRISRMNCCLISPNTAQSCCAICATVFVAPSIPFCPYQTIPHAYHFRHQPQEPHEYNLFIMLVFKWNPTHTRFNPTREKIELFSTFVVAVNHYCCFKKGTVLAGLPSGLTNGQKQKNEKKRMKENYRRVYQ